MIGGGDSLPLRARGLIGDTGTAALVAADGTIDWWCPGRFDAPAALFKLLHGEGGAVRVGPAGPLQLGEQSYDPGTNVLRTRLPSSEGELEVVDLMPWDGSNRPDGRIVRIVTALRGRVDVEIDVQPGASFGPARDVHPFSEGIVFDGVAVHAGVPIEARTGNLTLEAGDRAVVVIGEVGERGRAEGLSITGALDLLDRTNTAWRSHLSPLTYVGPHHHAVERSLLALKALTYGPTGTIVAAATTSLPERVGGERNWDYRYSWVRDASLAFDATYDAGLTDEAETFNEWLLGILAGATFPLHPMYDVDGLPLDDAGEVELGGLDGWRGSRPVRIGNGAADHLQLDFYADLVSSIHAQQFRLPNSRVAELWAPLSAMADWLATAWQQPDRGIWEIRSDPRHLVSSKLACWYALDRMCELGRSRNPLDLDVVHWRQTANEIRHWIATNGVAADGSLRADGSERDLADGYLVQVAWRNPWPGDDRVVDRTIDRTVEQLGSGPFLRRYSSALDDGFSEGEGAFLACSFWAVEALAARGRWEEAHERMDALCAFSGPLGLLPEEADVATGDFLGNLPQALSHLTLIQAALALARGPA
ncbi:MAG TPA: glycoside hydrolase family 15 protein [Acidimicrobiales bacterium]|nr:glycoside hydrolase family 15 protein [Acidimicrobiales bacterium]